MLIRYSLLVFASLLFVFALLSGSQEYGGGVMGILKNSTNALPWLILLTLVFVAWKNELAGGLLIILFGLGILYFFNVKIEDLSRAPFIISLTTIAFGIAFIAIWRTKRYGIKR